MNESKELFNDNNLYYLDRPKSHRKKMSLYQRSAQFAPFAALTGYEDSIKETARITNSRIEIDESTKEEINRTLQTIINLQPHSKIIVTYFVYDNIKFGGEYVTTIDTIKKIDTNTRSIYLTSGIRILIEEIISLEIISKQ